MRAIISANALHIPGNSIYLTAYLLFFLNTAVGYTMLHLGAQSAGTDRPCCTCPCYPYVDTLLWHCWNQLLQSLLPAPLPIITQSWQAGLGRSTFPLPAPPLVVASRLRTFHVPSAGPATCCKKCRRLLLRLLRGLKMLMLVLALAGAFSNNIIYLSAMTIVARADVADYTRTHCWLRRHGMQEYAHITTHSGVSTYHN